MPRDPCAEECLKKVLEALKKAQARQGRQRS